MHYISKLMEAFKSKLFGNKLYPGRNIKLERVKSGILWISKGLAI